MFMYQPAFKDIFDIFQKKSFNTLHITGTDISVQMLKVARVRDCYQSLLKLDLTKPLPHLDDTFDCLMCVGSTTYLSKFKLNYNQNDTTCYIESICFKFFIAVIDFIL